MRFIIIITSILLTSCHLTLCSWSWGYKQLREQPPRDKLVGQYEPIESSKEYLADEGFNKGNFKLELFENGQFKFINGPDLIFNSWGQSKQKLINKTGQWSVSCTDSYGCLIELEEVCVVPIAKKNGRIAILITIGDGDECNGVVYEKVD